MATAKHKLTDLAVQGRPDQLPRLLLPAEAAQLLRISLPQLYHLTSEKRIAFLKVGGQLRFDRDALLRSLAESAAGNPERPGRRAPALRTPARRLASSVRSESFRFKTPPRK